MVGALLISTVVGSVHVFGCWYSVAPRGSDFLLRHVTWAFAALMLLTVLYNVLHLVFDAVGLLFGRRKTSWTQVGAVATFCGVVFVITMLAVSVGENIRHTAYRGIAGRAAPLVAAIRAYQVAHGTPPDALSELVPEYLPAIPGTGVAAYPEYTFTTNSDRLLYAGNTWILFVDVSTDNLTRDLLLYYPDQNYPSSQQTANFTRVNQWVADATRLGDWALVTTAKPSRSN